MNFKIKNIDQENNKLTIMNKFYTHIIDFEKTTIMDILKQHKSAKWYNEEIQSTLFNSYNLAVNKLIGG